MKVVLLSVRIQQPADLAQVRDDLGVPPGDTVELALVQWRRPREELPVDEYLVLGPERGGAAWPAFRRNEPGRYADRSPHEGTTPSPTPGEAPGEIAGESASTDGIDDIPARGLSTTRVLRAVAWRYRRARRAVSASPLRARVLQSTKVRKVQQAVMPGGVASRFAAAALTSRPLGVAVAEADVVVSLDANSHRAAWLLARRHRGPHVVVGLAAARIALQIDRDGSGGSA